MSIIRRQTRALQRAEEIRQDAVGRWRDIINSMRFPSTSEGVLYGNSITDSTTGEKGNLGGVTVIGNKNSKKKPYFVSSRTGQLTAGDAAKALDTMVTPFLSWITPNAFRAIEGIQTGDIDKTALEGLKLFGATKGIGALSLLSKQGFVNGLKNVPSMISNTPKAALNFGKSVITPGSSFWTNPLTKRMLTGTGLSKGFDAASTTMGYNSWGEGVSDLIHNTTGWNPQDSFTGRFLTDISNPGWYINPSRVIGGFDKIGNAVKSGLEKLQDYRYRNLLYPQGIINREPLIARGDNTENIYRTRVSKLVESTELPLQLTDPRDLITNGLDKGLLRLRVDDILKLALERIGRNLSKTELEDYIGKTKNPLSPDGEMQAQFYGRLDDVGNISKQIVELSEEDMDEALENFNRFVNPKIIKTRYNNETPYRLDELTYRNGDGDLELRPNAALQRTYAGEHGINNWYGARDNTRDKVRKYINTVFNPNKLKIGKEIVAENPYDRSGVLVKGKDADFSIDSFESALNYITKALKKGRRFSSLKGKDITFKINENNGQIEPITHIRSNNFGLIKRYNLEFSNELIDAIKLNNGKLPAYIDVESDANNFILKNGGREVGRLIPRSDEDIVREYTDIIKKINSQYNLNIGYPEIRDIPVGPAYLNRTVKKIFWPNIYGLLYKKGGKFNNKNNNYVYKNI